MKNKLRILCAVIGILVLFSAIPAYAYTSYVTALYQTPLYTRADTSSSTYGMVDAGDVMGVYSSSGDFYYVNVGGRDGYVQKSSCTTTTSTSITAASQSISKYLTLVTASPIYNNAYTNSTIKFASIPAGTSIPIVSTSGNFYYVYYNNEYGYMPINAFGGATTGSQTMTVISSTYLYASANTASSVYTSLSAGQRVSVISSSGSFYYVSYGNQTGYIPMTAVSSTAGSNVFSIETYSSSSVTPSADGTVVYGNVAAGTALQSTPGGVTTATFPSGGRLGIISKTSSGYYYVTASGSKGYVPVSSVTLSGNAVIPVSDTGAAATAPAPSGGKSATIVKCKTNVNMREQPSASAKLLGAVPKGASITAYGKSGSYTQINYNGTTGYVLTKYVKKK